MSDHIIEAVTKYFLRCPLLKHGAFRVDALDPKPVQYVIETGTFDPHLQWFINGDEERQYQFTFGSREYYAMDRIQNMNNSGFYEDMAEWVETQSKAGIFPDLPEGMYAQSIEVMSPGFIFDITGKNARYQMPMRIVYIKEAK